MRFAEITREITINEKVRARRDSWPPYKIIGSGFNKNDLLQTRCIVVSDSSLNLHPYNPTNNDIMSNDWRLL